jgi:3-oxoacyl-[acyl-carrier-protein] synthase II
MKQRRVKITGLGFVTPAGVNNDSFRQGIAESRSPVSVITRFPENSGPFVAAEVDPFNITEYFEENSYRRMPRHTQFALVATKNALRDAGLSNAAIQNLAPVIAIGTALMDSDIINRTIENTAIKGPIAASSRLIIQAPVSAISAAVCDLVGGARTFALQSACCSGVDAIGYAANCVATGETDVAICVGTEAPIYYHPMLELRMAGLSPASTDRPEQLARPFDLWRTTGVIGEGACMMILEPESSPRKGYAFISGFASASDPSNTLGEGLRRAIEHALANARIRAPQIDMISAWGPGHKEIDAAECAILQEVFGERLSSIPAASIKGAIGNPFAAAGAIQAGVMALGMRDSFIPPTVNWRYPDPSCPLNLSSQARYMSFETGLIDSHGVSGTNSALVLEICSKVRSAWN